MFLDPEGKVMVVVFVMVLVVAAKLLSSLEHKY